MPATTTEPRHPLEVIAELGRDLLAYATEGHDAPAEERGPEIQRLLGVMNDDARIALHDERSCALIELKTRRTGKEIMALMAYKSMASIDQHIKGARGSAYDRPKFPDRRPPGRVRKDD
jgi:hypothetical protein